MGDRRIEHLRHRLVRFLLLHGTGWFAGYGVVRTTKLLGLLTLLAVFGCGLVSLLLVAKAKEVQELSTKRRLTSARRTARVIGHGKTVARKYP